MGKDVNQAAHLASAVAFTWDKYSEYPWRLQSLSTNIVENYFSQMRQKSRYFTAVDYMSMSFRCFCELVKKNSPDRGYTYPHNELGSCYEVAEISFSVKAIPLVKVKEKKGVQASIRKLTCNDTDRTADRAQELEVAYPASSRRFTIRESYTFS
jgi:hypothetical protein